MAEERDQLYLHRGSWAIYERIGDTDDQWEFVKTESADDPGTAARIACSRKWTAGKHTLLAVGLDGAYEYEITLETSGPVV